MTFVDTLGIEYREITPQRVEAVFEVVPALTQPFGYLHGGATLALLETVASRGAEQWADLEVERPFGVDISARHRHSAKVGDAVYGVAVLDREEPSSVSGRKQFWNIEARLEDGTTLTSGVMQVKIVPLARLAEKAREEGWR